MSTPTPSGSENTGEPYIVPHSTETITILYEDDDLLLVRKPHLLLSVPGKHVLNRDCLITRLQQTWPSARIVHRLDLDTSGIMAIALNKEAQAHISGQFQKRQVDKTYTAVVYGRVTEDKGQIDAPIVTDWPNRPKQKICNDTGKHALTRYEVVERFDTSTQVQLKPVTGRSHQLRIHLAHIGHPILGCPFYAHDQAKSMTDRMLLHATTLSFTHPRTGESVFGECPADFYTS